MSFAALILLSADCAMSVPTRALAGPMSPRPAPPAGFVLTGHALSCPGMSPRPRSALRPSQPRSFRFLCGSIASALTENATPSLLFRLPPAKFRHAGLQRIHCRGHRAQLAIGLPLLLGHGPPHNARHRGVNRYADRAHQSRQCRPFCPVHLHAVPPPREESIRAFSAAAARACRAATPTPAPNIAASPRAQ